ncbi:hypothetical protein LguiA_013690 [Lonicera macranthoides]
MGRKTKLRDLMGAIKDKASLSKATLLSNPNTLSLHLAVLRATTHNPPSTPPDPHHLNTLLTLGDGSRATASSLITSLIDRLHRTRDSSVTLKCLLTLHHILTRGPFILQDQLSIFPNSGGRNYLNLSSFHDGACATTWTLSAWARFYARYLETILSASRTLGFFLTSSSIEREKQSQTVSSYMTFDLIKDVESLITVIEEICKVPDSLLIEGNPLQFEIIKLMGSDYLSTIYEISIRIAEFKERVSCLSFGDSIELVCLLKRLEHCKEKSRGLFSVEKELIENMWGLVKELNCLISEFKVYNKEGGVLVDVGSGGKGSESARFGERVMKNDSVKFSSGRFGSEKKFSFVILDSAQSNI